MPPDAARVLVERLRAGLTALEAILEQIAAAMGAAMNFYNGFSPRERRKRTASRVLRH